MNKKVVFIILGIVLALILMVVGVFISTNNRAITMEEQIYSATASIEVQEKRRVDLVYNLVDAVQSYTDYESQTLKDIVSARASVTSGNAEDIKTAIYAIAEQYPELKANENYKQLMTELAMTENMIAEHRGNYNQQVRAYNKFTRTFPSSAILNMTGYEKINVGYTEYGAPSDAPQNLFG